MGVRIIGSGKALPDRIVTNDELADIVDTSNEWIVTRTGIQSRHIAVEETSCDLGECAARIALDTAQVSARDIDLVICATLTPDVIIPSAACLLKARLGTNHAVAFDLNAACAGSIYAIEVASNMIQGSQASIAFAQKWGSLPSCNVIKRALVVGVDRLSRIVDWTDRSTCVLFGDGAGAVVLEWNEDSAGILSSFLKSTDDDSLSLACAHLYDMSSFPFIEEEVMTRTGRTALQVSEAEKQTKMQLEAAHEIGPNITLIRDETLFEKPFVSMQGQPVFKFAAFALVEAIEEVISRAGISLCDVACIVPHQANERILRYAAKKLGISLDIFQISISEIGNTSASSVLIALHDAIEVGRIKPWDKVILVGFGGGLASGALLLEV